MMLALTGKQYDTVILISAVMSKYSMTCDHKQCHGTSIHAIDFQSWLLGYPEANRIEDFTYQSLFRMIHSEKPSLQAYTSLDSALQHRQLITRTSIAVISKIPRKTWGPKHAWANSGYQATFSHVSGLEMRLWIKRLYIYMQLLVNFRAHQKIPGGRVGRQHYVEKFKKVTWNLFPSHKCHKLLMQKRGYTRGEARARR